MINEIAQWAVLGGLTFLILGAFRHIAMSMPAADGRPLLDLQGPEVGEPVPRSVLSQFGDSAGDKRFIAFVSEGCAACGVLLSEIEREAAGDSEASFVVVARSHESGLLAALGDAGLTVHADSRDDLWTTWNVGATPMVVRVDSTGLVAAKTVGGSLEHANG